MNSKQRRASLRYWKYSVALDELHWHVSERRQEWLQNTFGRKNYKETYGWSGWNPVTYYFTNEKDLVAFTLWCS